MTKDGLIEALAVVVHSRETDGESSEATCDSCRSFVASFMRDFWPVIVAFVAEWLLHEGYAPAGTILKWREEMGGREKVT